MMRPFAHDLTIQVVRVKYGHPLGRGPEATTIGTLDTEAFNKSKAMELPRNIVIGHDALHAVGEVCQSLKLGKKALIVADENTLKIAGKTVEKELTARKIRTSQLLIPDATWVERCDGEERIRKGAFQFALGAAVGARLVRVQGARVERGGDVDRRLVASGFWERAQVLARPRAEREEARVARRAVRGWDANEDVPSQCELAGGPRRAPRDRRAD